MRRVFSFTVSRSCCRLLLAAALFASSARADDAPVEQVLTLPQSVQRALQNNQRLLSAHEDIRIAEQRVRESQSQHYPQAGLYLNSSRYLAEQDYVLPPEFGTLLLRPSRNREPDTFYAARVWLKQPLYNGGRTRHTIRLAETDLERARVQQEEVRGEVVFEVVKAFYDVLLRRKQILIHEEAASALEALASPAGDPARQGEIRSLQTQVRRHLSEKRREEERSRLAFLNALGLELYTRVGLEGKLETAPVSPDLAKLLAWAQESRLEIRRTDYQKEMDRLAVSLSLSERYPVVSLGAGYELNDQSFPLETTQWHASLNVSLPLFDGFSSRARIRQRRSQANQSRLRRAEIEDRVNWEVRESHGDLMYWQSEMARRQEDLERAQSAAAALKKSRDPVDAARGAVWLLEAQEAYWQSVHAHRVSLAKLEKAVGRPLGE